MIPREFVHKAVALGFNITREAIAAEILNQGWTVCLPISDEFMASYRAAIDQYHYDATGERIP